MSVPAPHPQTFGWIKGALDGSMSAVSSQLELVEMGSSFSELSSVPKDLHQIHSSLNMVELEGASLLARALEQLCRMICDSDDELFRQPGLGLLKKGLEALKSYIDAIARQSPISPLILVEPINEIRQFIGEPEVAQFDLFLPPLGNLLFEQQESVVSDSFSRASEEVTSINHDRVFAVRKKYRRALLQWLMRNSTDSGDTTLLSEIRKLLNQLFKLSPLDISQQLWWVAAGFVDAIASGDLQPDTSVKSQFARIDNEIYRLQNEPASSIAANPPDELLRLLLFYIGAIEESDSDQVKQIQQSLELPKWFSTEQTEYDQLVAYSLQLSTMGQLFTDRDFTQLESAISDFFSLLKSQSAGEQLSAASKQLRKILKKFRAAASKASLDLLDTLIQRIAFYIRSIEKGARLAKDFDGDIVIASAILFIKDSIHHSSDISANWRYLVESHYEELQYLITQVPGQDKGAEHREESRSAKAEANRRLSIARIAKAEYKHAKSAASKQLRLVLDDTETILSNYSITAKTNPDFYTVADQLNNVASIFSIVGLPEPAELCLRCRDIFNQVSDNQYVVSGLLLEHLAYAVAALQSAADNLSKPVLAVDSRISLALEQLSSIGDIGSSTGIEPGQAEEQHQVTPLSLLSADKEIGQLELTDITDDIDDLNLVQLDNELKSIFLDELKQHITNLSTDLAALSQADEVLVDTVMSRIDKTVHTLSGNCRNLAYDVIADLAEQAFYLLQTAINFPDHRHAAFEKTSDGLALLWLARSEINDHGQLSEDLHLQLSNHCDAIVELTKDILLAGSQESDQSEEYQSIERLIEADGFDTSSDTTPDINSSGSAFQPTGLAALGSGTGSQGVQSDIDEEIRQIFIEDAQLILDRLNSHLLDWKDQGMTDEAFAGIQRELHTLKGSAAAASYNDISTLSHSMETLLEQTQGDAKVESGALLPLLEEMHDGLAAELGLMETDSVGHVTRLMTRVNQLLSGEQQDMAAQDTAVSSDGLGDATSELADLVDPSRLPSIVETPFSQAEKGNGIDGLFSKKSTEQQAPREAVSHSRPLVQPVSEESVSSAEERTTQRLLRIDSEKLANLINTSGELGLLRTQLQNTLDATRMDLDVLRSSMHSMRQGIRDLEVEADAQIRALPEQQSLDFDEEFDPLQLDRFSSLQAKSREIVDVLDQLAKVERNLDNRSADLQGVLQDQLHLGDQLQSGLMSARMVSAGEYLPRLRYLVRETAKRYQKSIDLNFEGQEIQVDRQVIESMMAPFEHMIRNSVVHGIESPQERSDKGKRETGRITIALSQQGVELVVSYSDDGNGLDVNKLAAQAIQLGLVDSIEKVTEVELLQVIAQPGYSTSGSLSHEAGRGIGMDVVYQAVRELGGSISLQTEAGQGVQFQFRLPVTLVVTQVLMVRVSRWRFAIHTRMIDRLIRAPAESVVYQYGQKMLRNDQQLIPIIDIKQRLGELSEQVTTENSDRHLSLAIVRLTDRLIALEVDDFDESINIVSKPMGSQLDSIPEFLGVTILADSTIAMILDPEAFVSRIAPIQGSVITAEAALPKPLRILVVDDSLVVRKVMQNDLESCGFEVVTAADGLEALSMLDRLDCDAALVDIEMPRMNGYELLEQLRGQQRYQSLPVIMVTSRSGEQHQQRAMSLGANEYITKPYNIATLEQTILRLVDTV